MNDYNIYIDDWDIETEKIKVFQFPLSIILQQIKNEKARINFFGDETIQDAELPKGIL